RSDAGPPDPGFSQLRGRWPLLSGDSDRDQSSCSARGRGVGGGPLPWRRAIVPNSGKDSGIHCFGGEFDVNSVFLACHWPHSPLPSTCPLGRSDRIDAILSRVSISAMKLRVHGIPQHEPRPAATMECGGKRSATPLWLTCGNAPRRRNLPRCPAKAPSPPPLRSALVMHICRRV